jgi:hypothetical protein
MSIQLTKIEMDAKLKNKIEKSNFITLKIIQRKIGFSFHILLKMQKKNCGFYLRKNPILETLF